MVALRKGVAVNLSPIPIEAYDTPVSHGRWLGSTLRKRIEDKYMPEPMSGCWLWIGATGSGGYGSINAWKYGKSRAAHRIVYEMERGPIPDGMDLCHKCDVTSCVNPDHMFIGSTSDNIMDMVAKGRSRGVPGENNCKAKISENDVRLIRKETGTLAHIGRKYGLGTSAVHSIRTLKTWRHVA